MNEVQRVKTWIIRKHLALGRHLTILRTGETGTRRVTSLALSDSHTSSSFFFFFILAVPLRILLSSTHPRSLTQERDSSWS
jgi:hypothetical protein